MKHERERVEFENDRVKVTRVTGGDGATSVARVRADRLVIYLRGGLVARTEKGRREMLERRAGDVVWRPASEHKIEHAEAEGEHEVLIVELKGQ